ncbi:Phosphatidylinositol 4-phosphate 5-kinase 8 [Camellia lanceoleosa]|uniref:Phosphatidylinositol 4-phosphate 5-kinase 8 n=1 Tax=Camellia lanceoleosa TaxID=1840588 RepID=A0ACC0FVE4_9ERIC|nr:Phosphatidylinositol 4-phosphate 5-kinase 8 [Camellia lanceoleosa]
MKWVSGDLFDGFWLNGFRHGSGCYRFADGSYYFGTWTKGLKDGQGTYYPTGSNAPSLKRKGLLFHSPFLNSEECKVPSPRIKRSLSEKIINIFSKGSSQSQRSTPLDEGQSLCDSTSKVSSCNTSYMLSRSSDGCQHEVQDNTTVVFEREYMQGVLIKERIRKTTGLSYKMKKRSCIDIFEGHRSYHLMLNLQLGISESFHRIAGEQHYVSLDAVADRTTDTRIERSGKRASNWRERDGVLIGRRKRSCGEVRHTRQAPDQLLHRFSGEMMIIFVDDVLML